MQIDNFHPNSSAAKTFKEALVWRERLIEYLRDRFPETDVRAQIKNDGANFKVTILCSSESARRSINNLDLAIDIDFKPWYGAGEKI